MAKKSYCERICERAAGDAEGIVLDVEAIVSELQCEARDRIATVLEALVYSRLPAGDIFEAVRESMPVIEHRLRTGESVYGEPASFLRLWAEDVADRLLGEGLGGRDLEDGV